MSFRIYARAEVREHWLLTRAEGRHRHLSLPADNAVLWTDEEWILVEAPVADFEAIECEPNLVVPYAERTGEFPAGIGAVEEGRQGPFINLTDGNHRCLAARRRSEATFRAFVPLQDLEYLRPAWVVL